MQEKLRPQTLKERVRAPKKLKKPRGLRASIFFLNFVLAQNKRTVQLITGLMEKHCLRIGSYKLR